MAIRVAVVTLNLNGKDRLVRCLEGCGRLETQGLDVKVVCVDNHSTDDSVAEVRRLFPKVEVIVNAQNLGFARAYNEAVRMVDCDWVAFLNNDAVPDPAWLVEALAAAERHGAPCVGSTILKDAGTRVDFVGSTMNFYGHGFHSHFDEPAPFKSDERPMLFACAGAMLCSRAVFLEAGGFDEEYFAYFEDLDLGWRLNVLGHDVIYAPSSIVHHEHSATSSELVPPYQKLAWLERNGLRSVVKNYGTERLARVLPVALSLCVKRAQLDSAIDPATFFFENGPPGAAARAPLLPSGGRLRRVRSILGQRGLVDGWLYIGYRLLGRRFQGVLPEGHDLMNRAGYSRIAAMEAVISSSADLQARRAAIQNARRRSDESVVELFIDTFRPSFPHPELRVLQDSLADAFCLAELF